MGCVATTPIDNKDQTNSPTNPNDLDTESKTTPYGNDATEEDDDDDEEKPAWKIQGHGRGKNEVYIVPRNFKLLEELEFSEKGLIHDSELSTKFPNDINYVNYGLEGMDSTLSCWNASIIPIQSTPIGTRFYQLKMITGNTYPNDPPFMTFIQKVDLPFVDSDGTVLFDKIPSFTWNREKTMIELLVAIRHAMNTGDAAKKCAKIKEGTTYSQAF